jgi:hypothetical protein
MGSIKGSKGQPKCALVWRTGLSGVPPDSVRCTREPQDELFTFGKSQRRFTIIHQTVAGAPGESDSELASFGNPLRYNSPDCPVSHRTVSGAHRTVRCDSGATSTSRSTVDCNALNVHLRAQRSRACAGGTPDSLQGLSGAPPDSQAGPQDSAPTVEPQRSADVAGTPDCPVRHVTAAFQRPLCGGWGYKYPNHPTFKASKFSTFQLLTRALALNSRHTKEIKSSPNSTQSFSD